jgi:predicted transcriptional regulator
MRSIDVDLPDDLAKRLMDLASEFGTTPEALLRHAVEAMVLRHQETLATAEREGEAEMPSPSEDVMTSRRNSRPCSGT